MEEAPTSSSKIEQRSNLYGFCGNNAVSRYDKDGQAHFEVRRLSGLPAIMMCSFGKARAMRRFPGEGELLTEFESTITATQPLKFRPMFHVVKI